MPFPRPHLTHGPSSSYINCSSVVQVASDREFIYYIGFSVILNGSRHMKELDLRTAQIFSKVIVYYFRVCITEYFKELSSLLRKTLTFVSSGKQDDLINQ